MRKPASREPNPAGAPEGVLADASHRLEEALLRLETRCQARPTAADAEVLERLALVRVAESRRGWEQEQAALAEQLRRARDREQALQEVAALASKALGRATAEVRAALGGDGRDEHAAGSDAPSGGPEEEDTQDEDTQDEDTAAAGAGDEEAA